MKIFLFSVLMLLSTASFAERAVVFHIEDSCRGFVPNAESANGLPPSSWWDGDLNVVGRDAGEDTFPGSGKLTCKGYHSEELDQARVAKGFPCILPSAANPQIAFLTYDTVTVANPGGNGMLYCNFTKDGTTVIPNPYLQ